MFDMDGLFGTQVASAELAKAASAVDLIPGGKYPFQVTAITKPDIKETFDDGNTNPLFGHPVARVEVTLKGVGAKGYDELDGRDRKYFFNVTPDNIVTKDRKGNDRLSPASKIGGDMIAVSETAGKLFSETMTWFVENIAQISVGSFTTSDGRQMNVTALRLKRENERMHEMLGEAKRLLHACNHQDKLDVALTLKLLSELLNAKVL